MNFLEFLDAISDESIKKKKAYELGGEKWQIGRMDGGFDGAYDPYMEKEIVLVPKTQKPSLGPRFELRIYLKKEDHKSLDDASDPVMASLERNSKEKYGCKRDYTVNSWDCRSSVQGILCKVEDDILEAFSSLDISKLKDIITQIGDKLDADQPFPDDYDLFNKQFMRVENINAIGS